MVESFLSCIKVDRWVVKIADLQSYFVFTANLDRPNVDCPGGAPHSLVNVLAVPVDDLKI